MTTLIAKLASFSDFMCALWTDAYEFKTAFAAEFSLFTVLKLALRALHFGALPQWLCSLNDVEVMLDGEI
jgi:hypothetical protein